jgi:hypothetical protein
MKLVALHRFSNSSFRGRLFLFLWTVGVKTESGSIGLPFKSFRF